MQIARWITLAALMGLFVPMTLADEKKLEIADLPKAVVKAAMTAFPRPRLLAPPRRPRTARRCTRSR